MTGTILTTIKEARALLDTRSYQTRFFAALTQMESYRNVDGVMRQRPKLVVCSPTNPDAALSLRGAIIAAAGSGARAWPIFEAMFNWRHTLSIYEPPTKDLALAVLDEYIRDLQRARRVQPTRVLEDV